MSDICNGFLFLFPSVALFRRLFYVDLGVRVEVEKNSNNSIPAVNTAPKIAHRRLSYDRGVRPGEHAEVGAYSGNSIPDVSTAPKIARRRLSYDRNVRLDPRPQHMQESPKRASRRKITL